MKKYLMVVATLVALFGCDPNATPGPNLTMVDKTQDYIAPRKATVKVIAMPSTASPCPKKAKNVNTVMGCTVPISNSFYHIYIHTDKAEDETAYKAILEHEFQHVVFGPRHLGD